MARRKQKKDDVSALEAVRPELQQKWGPPPLQAAHTLPLTFVPPEAARAWKEGNPVDRQRNIPYLQKQIEEAKMEALCACQTPCAGDKEHEAWCYVNATAVGDMSLQTCPLRIGDKLQPENPARRVQSTGQGDYVRGCDMMHDAGVQQMQERATIASQRVARLLPKLEAEQAMVPLLMIEFNQTPRAAMALEAAQALSPREKLLSAALFDFLVRFLEEAQMPNLESMLNNRELVEQWKARLARFDKAAPLAKAPATKPPAAAAAPTVVDRAHTLGANTIIEQMARYGLAKVN